MELSKSAHRYLNTFPSRFKHEYLDQNHDESYLGGHSVSSIQKYEKMKNMDDGSCLVTLTFIDPTKKHPNQAYKIKINLNDKKWYTTLCMSFGVSKVQTLDGTNINEFTRLELSQNGNQIYAYTIFDKRNLKIPVQYQVESENVVSLFWVKLLDEIKSWIVKKLVAKVGGDEYKGYVNGETFGSEFLDWLIQRISGEITVGDHKFKSIDELVNKLSYSSVIIGIDDVIDYVFKTIFLPIQHLLVISNISFQSGDNIEEMLNDVLHEPFESKKNTAFFFSNTTKNTMTDFEDVKKYIKNKKETKQTPVNDEIHPAYYHVGSPPKEEAFTPYTQLNKPSFTKFAKSFDLNQMERVIGCDCGKHVCIITKDKGSYVFDIKNVLHKSDISYDTEKTKFDIKHNKYKTFEPISSTLSDLDGKKKRFNEFYTPKRNMHFFFIDKE